jgi:hypothetical protein
MDILHDKLNEDVMSIISSYRFSKNQIKAQYKKKMKRYKQKNTLKLFNQCAYGPILDEVLPTCLKEIVISYICIDRGVEHPMYQKRRCIESITSTKRDDIKLLMQLKQENVNIINKFLFDGISFHFGSKHYFGKKKQIDTIDIHFDSLHRIFPNFYIKNRKVILNYIRGVLLEEKQSYGVSLGYWHTLGCIAVY